MDCAIDYRAAVKRLETCRRPTVRKSIAQLHSRRLPGTREALGTLQTMRTVAKAALIIDHLAPQRLAEFGIFDQDSLINLAFELINDIAPVWYDQIMSDVSGGSDYLLLYPDPAGYGMGWEDWDELVRDPGDLRPDMAMYIFFTALRFGDREVFETASQEFGWEIDYPVLSDEWDWDRLPGLFEKAGLGCFSNALDVCYYQTGNVYFDWNPYDENGYYDADFPEFTPEGVERLRQTWEAAQPIMRDVSLANDRFSHEPELAKKIVQVLKKAQKGKPRQRTLVEIWGGGQDEDNEEGEWPEL